MRKLLDKYSFHINLILFLLGMAGVAWVVYDSLPQNSLAFENVSQEEIYTQDADTHNDSAYAFISGQVQIPGVYEIFRGETVVDLVEKAQGFSEKADLAYIHKCMNLAQKLVDEQKVYLPAVGEYNSCTSETADSQSNQSQVSSNGSISINNASQSELETLPGVGESTAMKIIENRPYETIESLKEVKGIGDATFEKLKSKISL
ncbi:MAG TPA: ComEA family DNA-binding protein [Candidatus Dojkabacteria bacterium]